MVNFDFSGKTAVVLGSGRGIGEAIVTLFAESGADVYIADLMIENCEAVKAKLVSKGYSAHTVKVDVSKYDEVYAALAKAKKETGHLDIVINNAGIVVLSSFLDATEQEIHNLINVNLMGANNGMQAALKLMIPQNSGKIVNTASFAGRHALKQGFAHYGMTKAGVIYLTEAAAYTGAPYNINVNAICPGIIRSAMWEKILDSYADAGQDRETSWRESLKTFIPLERGDQKPEDIAYSVAFLASEYADHITGQALNIDGGASKD